MRIDVRPVTRMRGTHPLDVTAALGPVLEALSASSADLARLTVVCDWIQYKSNFREVAGYRPILAAPRRGGGHSIVAAEHRDGADVPPPETGAEIAIDLRRCAEVDLRAEVSGLLNTRAHPWRYAGAGTGASPRVPIGAWSRLRDSSIWRFNALYWQALSLWEQATGREYEMALPGGQSAARDAAAVRDLILELFKTWDDLDSRSALPAELYVVELGVGNGTQASTWLDEFVELSRGHSRDYYRRLHYIMCDYSPHVLGRALKTVASHEDHISTLVVDATHPSVSLGFLRGKAFLVYISNVYDNLPCDEVARIGGRNYLLEARAYLPASEAIRIAGEFSALPERIPELTDKLLRLGPELLSEAFPQHFRDISQAVTFWRDVWGALRLAERYSPLEGLDEYQVTSDLTGELLRSQLESHGDIRVHVSNGALSSFAETLPLLHPFGRLQCHDLFLDDVTRYHTGFFGPGKYDGSVVNWVNAPLLRHIAGRAGFAVTIAPFTQRPSSSITTLIAAVRD